VVPATKAERPLWVQKGDARRNALQWARRAETSRSPVVDPHQRSP